MSDNIVKFPGSASRRVHSRKPRRSKNGTPEERAAKAAATAAPAADCIELFARPPVFADRRTLRGSPLRDKVGPISLAVTVVGKIYTADLRAEPLPPDVAQWMAELHDGAVAARYVADEFDKASARLAAAGQSEPPAGVLNLGQPVLSPEQPPPQA